MADADGCVQVFVNQGHLAACALACAYASEVPFQWASLLAVVQAGCATLEGLTTLDQTQQQLADELHKVCPCLALPRPALPALPCSALPAYACGMLVACCEQGTFLMWCFCNCTLSRTRQAHASPARMSMGS